MTITIITIWCLCGFIGTWRAYWGAIKDWYENFQEDYRKWNNGNNALQVLKFGSPIFIVGGVLTLVLFEYIGHIESCWYFKIPKK